MELFHLMTSVDGPNSLRRFALGLPQWEESKRLRAMEGGGTLFTLSSLSDSHTENGRAPARRQDDDDETTDSRRRDAHRGGSSLCEDCERHDDLRRQSTYRSGQAATPAGWRYAPYVPLPVGASLPYQLTVRAADARRNGIRSHFADSRFPSDRTSC
jgi:hypothetical protein